MTTPLPPAEPFSLPGLTGRIVRRYQPPGDLEAMNAEILRLLEAGAAEDTLHWGRNYIYLAHLETSEGPLPVAVKQFPGSGLKKRLRRKVSGTKAEKSWRVARGFQAAGLPTPEPVLLAEATEPGGPAWFVSRYLDDVEEARYLLRAVNAGREGEELPHADVELFLDTLAGTIRRMHEAGFWHRDMTSGNVLIRWRQDAPPDLYLVDLNRTREKGRLSLSQRTRDLSRMMIFRPEHQERFLRAYWGDDRRLEPSRFLYHLYHRGFLAKNETKKRIRSFFAKVKSWLFSRGTHAHIPDAPEGAGARDRSVWDHLSDQPHLHASRWEKLKIRVADSGAHLRQTAALVGSLPKVRRRYRELRKDLHREPVPFGGAGVAVRPFPEGGSPEGRAVADPRPELLEAVEELGARHVLLRLHPWQGSHVAEEALARALAERGYELTFALPQNRELVRDLSSGGSRWRRAVEELAERFTPYGRTFQVGQAVNRSKWGVWNCREWLELNRTAAEILRRHDGVHLIGPAVIDFEVHQTAGLVNLKEAGFRLDALASLLYVDRRGAPENTQLGFDSVDKAVLLRAIAETARNCGPGSWITEVNWPLREGPHSPAGKSVSVDEEAQADYLVRFILPVLATGLVERVFWWQMVARGYGLVEPPRQGFGTFRRRPAWHAFRHLLERLEGAVSLGPLEAPENARLYRFRLDEGEGGHELVVGWAVGTRGDDGHPKRGPVLADLPRPARQVHGRNGEELPTPDGTRVELFAGPRYFVLRDD